MSQATSSAPANEARESSSARVWQLAWPTIISNLLFTTVGFLHIKIAADLGTSAVAAVTTGHRVFFLVQAILMGLSVAATATVSRHWGAKQVAQAEMASWTALLLALVIAGLLSIPVLAAPESIAGIFGLDEATTLLAASFIFWLGLFNLFSAANMMLSTSLRATGDVLTPLYFLACSTFMNVLFGYALAFGLGPFPAMGVAGVALGGGIAGALVASIFVLLWWRGHFNLQPVGEARFDWAAARKLVRIALPAVTEQAVVQVAFLAFFAIVANYGTSAYAAYGIGISLVAFPIVVGFGFGIATATLVGQQLGAGRPNQAMDIGWRSLRMALLAMITLASLLAWYARDLAEFMINDPEVVELTVGFIYIICVAHPMMACDFALAGALRGAGDTRFPLVATFIGIIFGRLLPAWLCIALELSVYWVFSVMLLDYLLKSSLLLWRYRSRKWLKLNLDESEAPKL
ncbi:MAG: MATE family efflux transporter [Haliea sp.]|nr:MATE family efflux transporter [Haliea sp.]MDP5063811.1 MATE family efflux transporter [Haliea sp.]